MGRLLDALLIATDSDAPATPATSATPMAPEPTQRQEVARVAGVASPLVSKSKPAPPAQVTCEQCRHFVADPINPPAGAGTCAIGKGEDSIGPSLHPMAPRFCKVYVEAVTDGPESRLKAIAAEHGIDWQAARAWLDDEDIEASRPHLDSPDPRDHAGLITWLRVLADPAIVKIQPDAGRSPRCPD